MNMEEQTKINNSGWQTGGFDKFMKRQPSGGPSQAAFISGANFDALLDELLFNRMIRLKGLSKSPQGNDPGKIYWDEENNKFKIWVDSTGKWADVVYTTTSTSTSSSTSTTTT